MKLYFYISSDKGMELLECEAEEKPKMYILNERNKLYVKRVPKEDIGIVKRIYPETVIILDTKDYEKAKRVLKDSYLEKISFLENQIKDYQHRVDVIEEWREVEG